MEQTESLGNETHEKERQKKAIVAVARKLAVIMHKMLESKKPFERTDKKKNSSIKIKAF
ncbi:MAG: hypothetical protein HWD61_04560 [Parachlamydiaceae bacterium]|nr:MAG: hypothetical protein HWD61_04560 [Parachlamydiaceae bacterium]